MNQIYRAVALWSLLVVFANGDVPLCNVDYNNKFPTGSIMKNSIKELWQSKIMSVRRKLHLDGNKKDISICANCNVWDEVKGEEIISPELLKKFQFQIQTYNSNMKKVTVIRFGLYRLYVCNDVKE